MSANRIPFVDYLRVFSCIGVLIIHSTEPYYISTDEEGKITVIRSEDTAMALTLINSFVRSSVPLFTIISSYLMLPIKDTTRSFVKRRFSRVAIPFVVWDILYATLPYLWGELNANDVLENLKILPFNFVPYAGHLWYVYMIMGVYMFMPIISPWLQQASQGDEMIFIVIWLITTLWHYVVINCPQGLLGSVFWNEFHLLYYFSGYIGYVVLGHYIKTHLKWSRIMCFAIGIPLFLIGFVVTAKNFYDLHCLSTDIYRVEIPWRYCTLNVVSMTFGAFIVCKAFPWPTGFLYTIIKKLSGLTYGIYLMHIFILPKIHDFISPTFSVPLTVVIVTTATFVICVILCQLLRLVPGNQYILG